MNKYLAVVEITLIVSVDIEASSWNEALDQIEEMGVDELIVEGRTLDQWISDEDIALVDSEY